MRRDADVRAAWRAGVRCVSLNAGGSGRSKSWYSGIDIRVPDRAGPGIDAA